MALFLGAPVSPPPIFGENAGHPTLQEMINKVADQTRKVNALPTAAQMLAKIRKDPLYNPFQKMNPGDEDQKTLPLRLGKTRARSVLDHLLNDSLLRIL